MQTVTVASVSLLILITSMLGAYGADTTPEARLVTLEVLNPLAMLEVKRIVPAPRVTDLNHKRVLRNWVSTISPAC